MKKLLIFGLAAFALSLKVKDDANAMGNKTISIPPIDMDDIDHKDSEEVIKEETKNAIKDKEKYQFFINIKIEDSLTILVDSLKYPVYMFSNDTMGIPTCLNECAKKWPPLLVINENCFKNIPQSLNSTDFSTYKRNDGFYQVKYKTSPLYYYEGDLKPGDKPKGNNKTEFNGDFTTVSK